LLRKVKVSIMSLMSEDEIGEIRDELRVYKEQLDELRADIKTIVKYTEQLRNAVLNIVKQKGNPRFEAEIPRCQEFVDKYQIRIG
jgi:prefoldin subunit 5